MRHSIGITWNFRMAVPILGNGGNASMAGSSLVDIPGIEGCIGRHMGWKGLQGDSSTLVEGAKVGDISFVEGLSILSQHDIAVVGSGGRYHARTISPKQFFLLFAGPIWLFLIRTAFDAKLAIAITCKGLAFVVALGHVGPFIVLFYPGIDMLHIESNRLAQARNLCL